MAIETVLNVSNFKSLDWSRCACAPARIAQTLEIDCFLDDLVLNSKFFVHREIINPVTTNIKHAAALETSKMAVFVKIGIKSLRITGAFNGENLA